MWGVMAGGFPVDLILFAMVAAFLVLRLRSILGRRTGFERPADPLDARPGAEPRPIEAPVEPMAQPMGPTARIALPPAGSPAAEALDRITAQDPGFSARSFLEGAQGAFAMIVESFAKGDRETLRGLLSPDVFGDFDAAIDARVQANERQTTRIEAMREAELVEVDLKESVATLTVRFVTDQVNTTHDASGQVVAGSDVPTETIDLWSFSRDLSSPDPTWLLVATRSAV